MAQIKPTPSERRAKRESKAYYKKFGPKPNKNKRAKKKLKPVKKLPYETYAELRKLPYKDYLKSKYWKYVRGLVLKRDNNACIICKRTYGLQVHHDSYKHVCNELNHLGDLMTLCGKCHTEHHYAQP